MQQKLKRCSGCKACENVCPTGCLKIDTSDKIRFVREIDEEKCIGCKKCIAVCPMKKSELHTPMKGMIAWSEKRKIAKESSSGGIATTIYNYCIKSQVMCVGVHFEDSRRLVYDFIYNEDDIAKAVGSKYVYSDMNDIYQRIESKLKAQEKVVFIGLPCHVSGMLNYCKEKRVKRELLYTVDIVCHGVPMPYYFLQHTRNICKDGVKTYDFFFRKKDNPYGLTIENSGKVIYRRELYCDEYMIAFKNGYRTEGCYECPYATGRRCSDITLKDCAAGMDVWRQIGKCPVFGQASEVLLNTKKGVELFAQLKEEKLFAWNVNIESIISEEPRLQYPVKRPRFKRQFELLEEKIGFKYAVLCTYNLDMIRRFMRKHYRKIKYKVFSFFR